MTRGDTLHWKSGHEEDTPLSRLSDILCDYDPQLQEPIARLWEAASLVLLVLAVMEVVAAGRAAGDGAARGRVRSVGGGGTSRGRAVSGGTRSATAGDRRGWGDGTVSTAPPHGEGEKPVAGDQGGDSGPPGRAADPRGDARDPALAARRLVAVLGTIDDLAPGWGWKRCAKGCARRCGWCGYPLERRGVQSSASSPIGVG